MRIIGHGIDIISVADVARRIGLDAEAYVGWFHAMELDEIATRQSPAPTIAGRIAAKEAVAKALRTGFAEDVSWQDIVVRAAPDGAPQVDLREGAAAVAERLGVSRILLSISHSFDNAVASAIAIHD